MPAPLPALPTLGRRLRVGLALGLVGLAMGLAQAQPPEELRARGQALFEGRAELSGRIRGHADPLPTAALRCTNCHARTASPAPPPGSAVSPLSNTQAFGPVLDIPWLTGERPRRGAPASAYDARALCMALREGLDPQQVRMSRNMPLYELGDADCQALWAFLARAGRP